MTYVKRIESNVKAGCAVDLGPKTLIVGPNGAGKSTIVNAIELAMTGRASDVAGRVTLAKDAELATLIRTGDAAGFATATLDDGSQAGWTLTPGSKAARSGIEMTDSIFPLRDVRDNLTGAPDTARKWLLGHLAASTPWETVIAAIPEALRAKATTLAGGTVLGLPTALDTARKMAREETKRAEVLKTAARDAMTGLPPPLTAAEVEAAKVEATKSIRDMLDAAKVAGRTAVERQAKANAEVKDLEARFEAMPGPGPILEMGTAMIAVLNGQIATGKKKCGLCGGDALDPAARVAQITAAVESSKAAGDKRAVVAEALRVARAAAHSATQAVQQAAMEVGRFKALLDSAPEPAIVSERAGRWAQVKAQEDAALAATRTAAEWKELDDTLSTTVARIVESARIGFETRVQGFMPTGYRFGLDLTDSAARFGLRAGADGNEGPVRPALSGAEWALVTAALASAVAPPSGLSIVVPEDRPFDPATLTATLRAFSSSPSQVIIATPTMPTEVPEGWTVIAVGAPIAAAAAAPAVTAQAAIEAPAPTGKKRGRKSNAEKAALLAAGGGSVAAGALVITPSNGAGTTADLFETYQKPNPCRGCGVDLNVPGVMHSKACDGGAAADKGLASVGMTPTTTVPADAVSIDSLFDP